MPDRNPLTDSEIADALGTADTPPPVPEIPDPDHELELQFLGRVATWLSSQTSIEVIRGELLGPETLPSFRIELDAFSDAMTDRHICWYFTSPQSEWDRMAGRCGYALVMDGRVTHAIVILCS